MVKIVQANSSVSYLFYTRSFGTVCNSNISYYAIQYGYSRIVKLDTDWNYIKSLSISGVMFMNTLVDNNVRRMFISKYNGLSEIDENLNMVKSVSVMGWNYGLYFNSISVQLLVASGTYAIINVFNLNLTLIGNITVPYTNNYILEYNGRLFVSSQSSYIMVLQNQTFDHSFSTLCSYIQTFAVDKNGILAINCYSIIYLYNVNGTYTGQSWQSPISYSMSINFDINGDLIISNYYGLYVFSALVQTSVNSSSFSSFTTSDSCLIKGLFLIKFLNVYFKIKFFLRFGFGYVTCQLSSFKIHNLW